MLGYTFWHQLFVYSCNSCLFPLYMLLFSYPSVICLSCYLVIFCLQFVLLLFCAHCLYARALPFTHSLTRLLSTTLNSYVQILDALFLLFRCWMRSYILREAGASPYLILVCSSLFSFCYFLILDISDSFVIPVLDSYDIMCGCLYVILQ